VIRNSKQDWSEGSAVKVGFMTLIVVCAVRTPGDYAPDAYLLRNVNGTALYSFVPHKGLATVSLTEAAAMQDEADRQGITAHGRMLAAAKVERLRRDSRVTETGEGWAEICRLEQLSLGQPDLQEAHERHVESMAELA